MNRKSAYIIIPLIALLLMSCGFSANFNRRTIEGSGNLKTEQRTVSDIERVSLEGVGDLTVLQGDGESLSVEADDNILPYIETTMRGRQLVLSIKDGYTFTRHITIRYTLKVKNVNAIAVSGAGNVTAEKLNVGDLSLSISGAGNMKVANLQAQDLKTTASGSGNYDLKGKVKSQDVTISGVGNYTAGDLQSGDTQVTISGTGNATVWVDGKLSIHIAGFGNVNYYGKPNVSQSITGGGGVKSLGDHS